MYSHLVTFFRRYYKEGDFISLRRYKEGVYAIPYEGEEVKLHWANADQYYVKSAEHFRDYTFLLPDGRRVHFKLVEASTETDNNRAQNGNDRRFILADEESVAEQDGELVVRFEYRPDPDGRKRDEVNAESVERVLADPAAADWKAALAHDVRPDGAKEPLARLGKHLNTYTAKNEFDYFIHKHLGDFLSRELDFYLKNEVMHLDDIDQDGKSAPDVERYLDKLRAIRRVGHRIIDFLAQLEDFQKRLWLKKKFVVETHWCVTLDRVPEELYEEIAASNRQRDEWARLFAINEITGDAVTRGYSEPLEVEFLRSNPYLVVDTSLFTPAFAERILANIEDLDGSTDGLLVHSENFQTLNLLNARYRNGVQCLYIDPPYNTGTGDFAYKDQYLHSSWLTMMQDRIEAARPLMTTPGFLFVSLDENEASRFDVLSTQLFGVANRKADFIWNSRKSKQNDIDVSLSHNHTFTYTSEPGKQQLIGAAVDPSGFSNPDDHPRGPWKPVPLDAPGIRENSSFYPIVNPATGEAHYPPQGRHWSFLEDALDEKLRNGDIYFGREGRGRPQGRLFYEDVKEDRRSLGTIWDDVGTATDGTKELERMMGSKGFSTIKPLGLLRQVVQAGASEDSVVMDYFAGSGTTAHAAIEVNREDGGGRKYILVEVGEYFDTVMKPRVLKAVYSRDWKDGKPVSREGVSQLIKVVRLESYEDTLNNLKVRRTEQQQSLLDAHDGLRNEYMLRYWLDVETRGSASLLGIKQFDAPWSYVLNVARGSAAETRPVTVDLVETFNYLIGLRVRHVDGIRGVTMVQGALPSGETALVIWRKVADMPSEELDRFLFSQRINPRDMEFDVIYVNGDNHLENTRRPDETWKVRLIEEEFLRLMFETADRA